MDQVAGTTVGTVESEDDLIGILALQRASRAPTADGFVTVEHSLDALRAMHALAPSVVARNPEGRVVAYALVMPRDTRALIPILEPMFQTIEALPEAEICGRPGARWYVMGQVAVAAEHRGTGLFARLYDEHKRRYSDTFDAVITEVATRNPRSLQAHRKVGFRTISTYRDATDEWALLAWEWR